MGFIMGDEWEIRKSQEAGAQRERKRREQEEQEKKDAEKKGK